MEIKINWIDINEKQPKKNQYVLCYSKNTGIKMDIYEYTSDGVHWFYGDEEEYETSITHWSEDIIVIPNGR